MSPTNYSTLSACLADVPDPRDARGKRHEWLYLLTLIDNALG